VADALAMKAFLIEVFGVPPDHIQELHNTLATGENIKAAILGFNDDTRIQPGDSFLIYFAGHGSEVPKSQCISEMAPKIQMIIPHNFNPRATQPEVGQGILDYSFSDWFAKVAKVKGG
jgi:uncharacterized caspase-like protein